MGSAHGETGTRAVRLFLECVTSGESAIHKLAGGKDVFEWLQRDPELTRLFNGLMTSFSVLHITGLLEAYDFSAAQKIVDVGGGHGKILSEILQKNPGTRGILVDLPHAFEGGKNAIAQAGLADRCERTEEEYRTLYKAAGFELTRTVATKSPTGTTVIEGSPI
jgi:O-methyltransferase domain